MVPSEVTTRRDTGMSGGVHGLFDDWVLAPLALREMTIYRANTRFGMGIMSRWEDTARSSRGTSIGIKLLAAIIGVAAFVLAIAALQIATTSSLTDGATVSLLLGVFMGIVGVGLLVVAAGLWIGRSWAWTWGFALYTGATISSLIAVVQTPEPVTFLQAVVPAFVVMYLYSKREQFDTTNTEAV